MAPVLSGADALRRLFAAATESTFQGELGVADPHVIDYLTDLLVRFVRYDALLRVRDTTGRRLDEVAEMIFEAEHRQGRPQREIHRHIGDVTLFWSGVYPEALTKRQAADRKDHLLDYRQQGKLSYYIASTFDDEPYRDEAPVLRRLSVDFELCSFGLQRVRREWESWTSAARAQGWEAEQN